MSHDRRSFMKFAVASYGAFAAWMASVKTAAAQRTQLRIATDGIPLPVPYKRIATEEAWTTPEIMAEWRKLREQKPADEPGFLSLWGGIMDRGDDDPRGIIRRLLEMDKVRIVDMDAAGIDVQLLLLTSPGVQVFTDHDKAVKLAADSNDQVLGADRVVYAMDYPFQYLIHEVPEVDSFPITLEEKKMLFQGNAERLFKLKPRPA